MGFLGRLGMGGTWAEESGELWSTFAHGVDGRLRIPKSNASLAGWVAINNEIVNIPDVSQVGNGEADTC